jgi:hypothetical protein
MSPFRIQAFLLGTTLFSLISTVSFFGHDLPLLALEHAFTMRYSGFIPFAVTVLAGSQLVSLCLQCSSI